MTAPSGNVIRFLSSVAYATGAISASAQQPAMRPLNVAIKDMKWQKLVPQLGDRSSEIAILRVDSKTQATQIMIRVPSNYHVPRHWHSANETQTILSGAFIIECEGQRAELGPGSFYYAPRTLPHEAWTKPDVGALIFITVDGAWDINWVNGPPKPEDYTPRPPR